LSSNRNGRPFTGDLYGGKISEDYTDDDAAEPNSMLAGDKHFPEVRHGAQFSRSPDIPSLLLDFTLQTVRRN
jgi:hypothetical protein